MKDTPGGGGERAKLVASVCILFLSRVIFFCGGMCEGCMFHPFTLSLAPQLQYNESVFIGPDVKKNQVFIYFQIVLFILFF